MDNSLPGSLITAATDEFGNNRVYLVLPDQRKLPLPHHFRAEEFALPGNLLISEDRHVHALYDESTRTGAVFSGLKQGCWTMWQPVTREDFFGKQVPAWIAMSKLRADWNGML